MNPHPYSQHLLSGQGSASRRELFHLLGRGSVLAVTMGWSFSLTSQKARAKAHEATPTEGAEVLRPCVNFQEQPIGTGPNPIVTGTRIGAVAFEVPNVSDTQIQTHSLSTSPEAAFSGLTWDTELIISVPEIEAINLTLVCLNDSARVSAFDAVGNTIGSEVEVAVGKPEIVRISVQDDGQAITQVRIATQASGTTVLLECCLEPSDIKCLDFRNRAEGEGPNPRLEQGALFLVSDFSGMPTAKSEIWDVTSSSAPIVVGSGLNLDYYTYVFLPVCAAEVEVTMIQFYSAPTSVEALDDTGTVVAMGSTSPTEQQEHTVRLKGGGIAQVRIRPPQNETVLRGLCYRPC